MVQITSDKFGVTSDGKDVHRYTFTNGKGVSVGVLNYGGNICSINVPSKTGKSIDVALGFDKLEDYEVNPPYIGALIGRVCNRIHKGKFSLDGVDYELVVNNGPNHIHGGLKGFDKKVWDAEITGEDTLKLEYTSVDGEEGYPGAVKVVAQYRFTEDSEIILDYKATSTKATPINLTNHSYFNLAGQGTHRIDDHIISIAADKFLPKDEDDVPSGEIANVAGTAYDIRKPTSLSECIDCDFNYCINEPSENSVCARVEHPGTGIVLEVRTNQPGLQFYTSKFLDVKNGKAGTTYVPYSAFCLEAQNYPNAINTPDFPSCVLRPGETYHHVCVYKFSTKK
ncbi:galactose mutarotase-like [Tubulanus polymorphus]|uniref:galactose mutarotase-like n=1 Tax=Tubulanus polymorphus TaxID=672921 RepID=UPI003DA3F535